MPSYSRDRYVNAEAGYGTKKKTPDSNIYHTTAASQSVSRETTFMWWFFLLSIFWMPVAGYYIGGWTFAAICGMSTALCLCWISHITDLERTGTCSRFTRILWAHMLLCAAVIPALGYVSGGWLDVCIYAIYATFIVCSFYRFERLRQWNATEARELPLSMQYVPFATTKGISTLEWIVSLEMLDFTCATPLTKRTFWLLIMLIAILAGAVTYACRHLPAAQWLWPLSAEGGLLLGMGLYCHAVNLGRMRGDRFW